MAPLILYSTNTLLAYLVAERYYGGIHYAWCSAAFGSQTSARFMPGLPPSSCPSDLLNEYRHAIVAADRHAACIERNRAGIVRGATVKHALGHISDHEREEVIDMAYAADIIHLRPLVFVIPYFAVSGFVKEIGVAERAAVFTQEYLIEELPRGSFDVLSPDWD